MRDYIERNRLKTVIEKNFGHGTINPILQLIDEQPTANVVEVVHGEWLEDIAYYDENGCPCIVARCSNCGEAYPTYNYCPNCGAKMEVKE